MVTLNDVLSVFAWRKSKTKAATLPAMHFDVDPALKRDVIA
jgi:hypothetical protein